MSIELMAKMKRQKEAKKQAEMQKELAEKRRREALLAVEKADEEYRRACEAERQATEAASGTLQPPSCCLVSNLSRTMYHVVA